MIDKIPPHAIESEKIILGCCMAFKDTSIEVVSELPPEAFYNVQHGVIYNSICRITQDGKVPDMFTVLNDLNGQITDPAELMALTNFVTTDKNIMQHVLMVKEKYILREYIRASDTLSKIAYSDTLDEVVGFIESNLLNISSASYKREPMHVGTIIENIIERINKIKSKQIELAGVPSGFTSLDRVTGGWSNSDLIIIAARPGVGKTAMALQLAMNTSKLKYPVAFFSLEMSSEQLAGRCISSETEYTNIEIRTAKNINVEKLSSGVSELSWLPFFIDDTANISILELRSKLKKLKHLYGIKVAVVDYLQLMKGERGGNREQEISSISRGLKMIAKELEIPIIALAQLNRGIEARKNKAPMLSDLRESGAIEQDADIVIGLNRPAMNDVSNIDIEGYEINTDSLLIMDFLKHRNGPLATVLFSHNKSMTKISEFDEIDNDAFA